MERPTTNYRIDVVHRTLDLLDVLADADEPLGATELAQRMQTTKSAAYRILINLEQRKFVARDAAWKYRLGPRLAYLGHRSAATIDLRLSARPELEELHQRVRETIYLGVLDGDSVLLIDAIESESALRVVGSVGDRKPTHTAASGKALLAALPEDRRHLHVRASLAQSVEQGGPLPASLADELAHIRETGIAIDRGQQQSDVHEAASPVFDYRGEVVAAIAVSGPASRLDETTISVVAQAVRQAARNLTKEIGGREPARWPATNAPGWTRAD